MTIYATVSGNLCVSESRDKGYVDGDTGGTGDTWVATSATYLVKLGSACLPLS